MIFPAKLDHLPRAGGLPVPWVALWSAEQGTAFLRDEFPQGKKHPCVAHEERIGEGRPVFGKTSQVRQRRAMLQGLCQVCGRRLSRQFACLETSHERWASRRGALPVPVLTESPTCATCAVASLEICPGLKGLRFVEVLRHVLIMQFVRPVGDPALDGMFDPLTLADFPEGGAVGYMKYAVTESAPWAPPSLAELLRKEGRP